MTEPDERLVDAMRSLERTVEALRAELVRRDVYESDQRGVAARIDTVSKDVGDLEKRVEKSEDDRKADRRLLIAAFVSPLLLLVAQLYLSSQGAA